VSTRAAVGVVLLAAACARATPVAGRDPEEAPREARRVTVVVQNNLRQPSSLTVWAVARHGGRQRLGTVLPDRTESLRFVPDLPSGEYVLVGRTDYGAEVVSNPFSMSRALVVSWNLFSNIALVTITESDAGDADAPPDTP
jgi:hypothetical protein